MVSKAKDDLPEPLLPEMTMSLSRGSSRSTFLRLCSRAPLMISLSTGKNSGFGEQHGLPAPDLGRHVLDRPLVGRRTLGGQTVEGGQYGVERSLRAAGA